MFSFDFRKEKRQGARLGDQVIIQCADGREVNSLELYTWFYRKDRQSKPVKIACNDKSGKQLRNMELGREMKILHNLFSGYREFQRTG